MSAEELVELRKHLMAQEVEFSNRCDQYMDGLISLAEFLSFVCRLEMLRESIRSFT